MSQKVVQKGGESAISYINIFQNAKALETSIVNNYYGDQFIHTLLDNLQKGGK